MFSRLALAFPREVTRLVCNLTLFYVFLPNKISNEQEAFWVANNNLAET